MYLSSTRKHGSALLAGLASLWLATACQVLQQPASDAPVVQTPDAKYALRQQQLQDLTHWQAQGKIGLSNQQQSQSGLLNWQQDGQDFSLHISGPLGQQAIHIQGNNNQITAQSGNTTYQATSISRLIQQALGWEWPEAQIQYWALGLVSPGIKATYALDEQGRLVSLNQGPWQINYSGYQIIPGTDGMMIWLPHKITLAADTVTLRLIMNRWEIQTPRPEST